MNCNLGDHVGFRRRVKAAVVAMAGTAGLAATLVVPSGLALAAGSPIKIALITSETGIAASEFSTSAQGFLARIDLQNAEGGVNGRKIDPIVINDQGSLTTVVTAVQQAISEGVVGIVNATPFFFAAYKYAEKAGIPVTGGSFDGPEWGEQPNTNMFASDVGSIDPTYPINIGLANFLKSHGGTVLGTYGYAISSSSSRAASDTADRGEARRHEGGGARHLDPLRRCGVHDRGAGSQVGGRQCALRDHGQ